MSFCYLSLFLSSITLSFCQFLCLSAFVSLSLFLSAPRSFCVSLSLFLFVFVSLLLFLCLTHSISLPVSQPYDSVSLWLCIALILCLSTSMFLSLSPSLYFSGHTSLSICLSLPFHYVISLSHTSQLQ